MLKVSPTRGSRGPICEILTTDAQNRRRSDWGLTFYACCIEFLKCLRDRSSEIYAALFHRASSAPCRRLPGIDTWELYALSIIASGSHGIYKLDKCQPRVRVGNRAQTPSANH